MSTPARITLRPRGMARLQARLHRGAAWCRSLAADVRALQIDALDDSLRQPLHPPAMPVDGAITAGAGLTPAQRQALADDEADDLDTWVGWAAAGLVLGVVLSALYPWGLA